MVAPSGPRPSTGWDRIRVQPAATFLLHKVQSEWFEAPKGGTVSGEDPKGESRMTGRFRNACSVVLGALASLLQASPGPASAAPDGPPSSCQGEAVLAAPGKVPGTESTFFAVPSISSTVAFTVAGEGVTLTIGQQEIRYTRRRADRAILTAIVAQLGDLDEARRAVWLDSLLGGGAIVAANQAEMLLVLREPAREGWTGLMLKDGAPAAFLSLRCG